MVSVNLDEGRLPTIGNVWDKAALRDGPANSAAIAALRLSTPQAISSGRPCRTFTCRRPDRSGKLDLKDAAQSQGGR